MLMTNHIRNFTFQTNVRLIDAQHVKLELELCTQ